MPTSKWNYVKFALIAFCFLMNSCRKDSDPQPATTVQPNGGFEPVSPIPAPNDLAEGITLMRGTNKTVFTKILEVPWAALQPGDIVYIKGGVYHEKLMLSASGTKESPIRVVGVPGSDGKLPVIDGENANSKSGEHTAAGTEYDLNTRSLICIGNRPSSGSNWGKQPKHITIENLEIRNAGKEFKYKIDNGALISYDDFTAAIWVDRVTDFKLINCIIHNSGSGLFINSRAYDEPNNADISRDILIQGNYFYDNGVVGSYLEHNTYIEAINVVYQFNRYAPLRKGAPGSTLKDRSAGTIVRYNWMEGSARILDLVESEEGWGVIGKDPSYKEAFVYGNVFYNGPSGATSPYHWGGDKYKYGTYRRGTLYFYHNTIVNVADQKSEPGRWYTILFQLPSMEETGGDAVQEVVDCRNNIIYNTSETKGKKPTDMYWLSQAGRVNLGSNWVSPEIKDASSTGGNAIVVGKENLVVGDLSGVNTSPFKNYELMDFSLTSSSRAVDVSGPLHERTSSMTPGHQYKLHQQFVERAIKGSKIDAGALELN